MKKRMLLVPTLSTVLMFYSGFNIAEEQERIQENIQTQKQVRGWELMTNEERAEQQAKMRNAITEEEREQIRKEQHELMKERARERGLTMPDEPPSSHGEMGSNGSKHKGD